MFDASALFLVALLGGVLPLLRRWTERQLHGSLALSTGILLGAVFFHLLPAISHEEARAEVRAARAELSAEGGVLHAAAPAAQAAPPEDDHDHDHPAGAPAGEEPLAGAHDHGSLMPWLFVLVGVLGVYLVEALALRTHDHDEQHRHRAVGLATLVGLTLHALTAGISYPAADHAAGGSTTFFLAFLLHKTLETFSLTTVLELAGFGRGRIAAIIVAFALVTPGGVVLGELLSTRLSAQGLSVFSALAAGTFLYVCLCELLPEVFHHREDSLAKIGLLVAGIGVTLALHGFGA